MRKEDFNMSKLVSVLSGVGLLIGIFLFLDKGTATVNIINTIAGNSVKGIKTLQGR